MKATEINPINGITIGGSEVAAALGASKYTTPAKLWRIKKGLEAIDPNQLPLVRGRIAEKFIEEYFRELNPNLIQDASQHKIEIGVARATIDGVFKTPDGSILIIDYKSEAYKNEYEVPLQYIMQLTWYGGLYKLHTGVTTELGIVSCDGWFNLNFIPISFDIEYFDILNEKIGRWYEEHIINDKEPGMDTHELARKYDQITETNSNTIELDSKLELKLIKLQDLNARKKDIEEEIEKIKDEIKVAMGENERATCGDFTISYALQQRSSIDTKILKSLVADDIITKATKTSQYRVLRIS